MWEPNKSRPGAGGMIHDWRDRRIQKRDFEWTNFESRDWSEFGGCSNLESDRCIWKWEGCGLDYLSRRVQLEEDFKASFCPTRHEIMRNFMRKCVMTTMLDRRQPVSANLLRAEFRANSQSERLSKWLKAFQNRLWAVRKWGETYTVIC